MGSRIGLSVLLSFLVSPVQAADKDFPPKAGWYGILPHFPAQYIIRFKVPVVEAGEKPTRYHQTILYEWSGNRFEVYTVTVARDSSFKDTYSAENLRKQNYEENRLDKKHTAWLWKDSKRVPRKMVIPLGEDRALLANVEGMVGVHLGLLDLAKAFDLERVTKALDHPPRTVFGPRIEDFKQIPKNAYYVTDFRDWISQIGVKQLERDGDRNEVLAWTLGDGSHVLVGLTAGFGKVVYVKHDQKGAKIVDLVK